VTLDNDFLDDQSAGADDPGMQAFAVLTRFLNEDGWYPQPLEQEQVLRAMFAGENGEYRCYAQIRPDLQQFLFYVVAPVLVAEEMRPAGAEYLTRANYGLRIGNFEMDFSDGEVRYKTSLDFEGEMLTDNWLRNAIYPAVQTMDHYMPGLLSVALGNKTADEAIQELEEAE
jgi:hypothetical protein